jgi:hypothetical protein
MQNPKIKNITRSYSLCRYLYKAFSIGSVLRKHLGLRINDNDDGDYYYLIELQMGFYLWQWYYNKTDKTKSKLSGLNLRANYTDRATAACWRS